MSVYNSYDVISLIRNKNIEVPIEYFRPMNEEERNNLKNPKRNAFAWLKKDDEICIPKLIMRPDPNDRSRLVKLYPFDRISSSSDSLYIDRDRRLVENYILKKYSDRATAYPEMQETLIDPEEF